MFGLRRRVISLDPVCGTKVSGTPKYVSRVGRRSVAFCSRECQHAFWLSPDDYMNGATAAQAEYNARRAKNHRGSGYGDSGNGSNTGAAMRYGPGSF
jgi:YHS domain-containing protein